MKKIDLFVFIIGICFLVHVACEKEESVFYKRDFYKSGIPEALSDFSKYAKYEVPKSVKIETSILMYDTLAAVELGKLLFHMPTRYGTACADCHSSESGYYALTALRAGGGKFRGMYDSSIKKMYRDTNLITGIPIDEKTVKSRTALGLFYNKERILSAGFESDHTGELQVSKAEGAHFMPDLTLAAQHDFVLNQWADSAFQKPIDIEVVRCAISAFEQNLLPYENNISRFLRGESNAIYGDIDLFDRHCYDCHTSNSMQPSLSMQMDSVLVPFLFNVSDSPCYFTDCNEITLYKAIQAHFNGEVKDSVQLTDTLTQTQIYAIRRFLTKDYHDPLLTRYDE